jgi:TPR repeat protein
MVEQAPQYRSGHTEVDPFDENTADHRVARYKLRKSARTNYPEDSVPLFLSDYDGEPDPNEYITPLRKKRSASISARILAGVSATAAAAAIVFALLSSDATRDIIASAKASSAAVLSAASSMVHPNNTQLTARDIHLKDPAQSNDPARRTENQMPDVPSIATAVAPTREDIKTAYQSALQGGAPQAAAVAELTIPGDAIHHLDPAEIAASLRRGDDLIASGDLAAARLVLRRAANAGDAQAAMRLAGTYDPMILAKLGVHGFVPDVSMARVWYEKAKKFGAAEAPRRLELLASK